MRKILLLCLVVAVGVMTAGAAVADMAADTKALVEKGVAMFKDKGKDEALKAMNDPKGPFVQGELYLFAVGMDNVVVAHPLAKALVGKDQSGIKDPKGNAFFVKFTEVAEKPGSGWVEYWWPKPNEKEPSAKDTFIMKVPGEAIYVGGGYYK